MGAEQKTDIYTQMMENVVAALRKDGICTFELGEERSLRQIRAVLRQIPEVDKVGLVTVRMRGGIPGKKPSFARVGFSDIDVHKSLGVAALSTKVPVHLEKVRFQIANAAGSFPVGQERLEVVSLTVEPEKVLAGKVNVRDFLHSLIGGQKINDQFGTAFSKELAKHRVQLMTCGLRFTGRNTLQVSLRANKL